MFFNILLSLWISLLCTLSFSFPRPFRPFSRLLKSNFTVHSHRSYFNSFGNRILDLTRYPHTLKYFKLDFLSFHFSYGKDHILIKQNLFLSKRKFFLVDLFCSKDSSSTQVLCKPELINNAPFISFNVRFFIRLRWIWQ